MPSMGNVALLEAPGQAHIMLRAKQVAIAFGYRSLTNQSLSQSGAVFDLRQELAHAQVHPTARQHKRAGHYMVLKPWRRQAQRRLP